MKLQDLVKSFNENDVFVGTDKNGRTYATVGDGNGNRYFVNHVALVDGVENGLPKPMVDANGKRVYRWDLGNQMKQQ